MGFFRGQRFDYTDAKKIKDVIPRWFFEKCFSGKPGRKRDLERKVRSIFMDFLGLVMDDLIENNNTFISPNSNRFKIRICEKGPMETERVLHSKKNYQYVDIVASDGKVYQFYILFELPRLAYRPIRISPHRYRKLVEKVNQGKRYYKDPFQ